MKNNLKKYLAETVFDNYYSSNYEKFISDNISLINEKNNLYTAKHLKEYFKKINRDICVNFTDTDIQKSLNKRFRDLLKNPDQKNNLLREFKINGLLSDDKLNREERESRLIKIANELKVSKKSVFNFYESYILEKCHIVLTENKKYVKRITDLILDIDDFGEKLSKNEKKQIQKKINSIINNFLELTLSNGFKRNADILDYGGINADEGDAIQFLFVARAMLAGFNCSNVDLRSSKYDAVIDIEGEILRIQVKGISGNTISLKDRDRGGEGIDPMSHRNRGNYISSRDIDIYAAVDKYTGLCYLIPASKIENLISEGKNSCSIKNLELYKENWDIIKELENK